MLRYEYKYFVRNDRLADLRSMIAPHTVLDDFAQSCKQQRYSVRSIYFETPDFNCYHSKVAGLKNRNKVRLRGYDEGGAEALVFMEIKYKYEQPILKKRSPMPYFRALDILNGGSPDEISADGGLRVEAASETQDFLFHVYSRQMQPVIKVVYEREPWLDLNGDTANNLRITLDYNLRVSAYPTLDNLYEEAGLQYVLDNCFILEVKFNHYFPTWMQPIVSMLGLTRESASKYCLGIEALADQINPRNPLDTFVHGRFFGTTETGLND